MLTWFESISTYQYMHNNLYFWGICVSWDGGRVNKYIFHTIVRQHNSKKELSQSVQTSYSEWPWDILQVVWFGGWKVKGQG